MASGEALKILVTNPDSVKDLQAFTKQTGTELPSSQTTLNEFIFLIRKK